MPKSKSSGFRPIEVEVGKQNPPLTREVIFSDAKAAEGEPKSEPARPAKQKESDRAQDS